MPRVDTLYLYVVLLFLTYHLPSQDAIIISVRSFIRIGIQSKLSHVPFFDSNSTAPASETDSHLLTTITLLRKHTNEPYSESASPDMLSLFSIVDDFR